MSCLALFCVRRGVNGTRYQTVNFVLFQHQRTENHVVFQLFAGNGFGHAFALTQFNQTCDIAFANHFRVNDFDASAEFNTLRRRNAVDQHVYRLYVPVRSTDSGKRVETDDGYAQRSRSETRSSQR